MEQVIQVVGALLILTAFALAQFHVVTTTNTYYLILNLVGSAILAYLALVDRQWGFVLLETVWALVSAWGLFRHRGGVPAPESG